MFSSYQDQLHLLKQQQNFIYSHDTIPLKDISFSQLFNAKSRNISVKPKYSNNHADKHAVIRRKYSDGNFEYINDNNNRQNYDDSIRYRKKENYSDSNLHYYSNNDNNNTSIGEHATRSLTRNNLFNTHSMSANNARNTRSVSPKDSINTRSVSPNDLTNIRALTPGTLNRIYGLNNLRQKKRRSKSCTAAPWLNDHQFPTESPNETPVKKGLKRSLSDSARHSGDNETNSEFDALSNSIQDLLQTDKNNKPTSLPVKKLRYKKNMGFDATFMKKGWQEILQDLDDVGRLDSKLLEAIYLLRNAHKTGFFNDYKKTKVKDSNDRDRSYSTDSERSNEFTSSTDSLASGSLPSSIHYSGDSACSSGRSTPTVRKRPKRPEIVITDHRDYYEIRRSDSISSIASEADSMVSDCSYIDITDDMIIQAVCESQLHSTPNYRGGNELSELEETLRDDTPIPKNNLELCNSEVESLCLSRPDSPTSEFLMPILTKKDEFASELHRQLSPLLHKLKYLEEETKTMSSLEIKLQKLEEKNQELVEENYQIEERNQKLFQEKQELAMILVKHQQLGPKNQQLTQKNQQLESKCQQFEKTNEQLIKEKQKLVLNLKENEQALKRISDKKYRDIGVQKYLEIFTQISHKSTTTEQIQYKSIGIGNEIAEKFYSDIEIQKNINNNDFSCQKNYKPPIGLNKSTKTETIFCKDQAIGEEIADKEFISKSIQCISKISTNETQTETISSSNKENMTGTPLALLTDSSCGDNPVKTITVNQECQSKTIESLNQSSQSISIETTTQGISVGCSYSNLNTIETQCKTKTNDFACGENIAEIKTQDKTTDNTITSVTTATETNLIETKDFTCSTQPLTQSIGTGDNDIHSIICDQCTNKTTSSFACGTYLNLDPCCVDDKLCDCIKPELNSVYVGDCTINDICCDRCENLQTRTLGVSNHKIDDVLCDKCENTTFKTIGIGNDCINDLLCDKCSETGKLVDQGVGDFDINAESCEKCLNNVFNFDLNINTHEHLKAVLCHYCGNKVDLDDENLDESLQAMRESMTKISSGMKRTATNLNLEFEHEDYGTSRGHDIKDGSLESPASDDYSGIVSDEEDDAEPASGKNDVIDTCQKLHDHFSGMKPLNKTVMLKYMGIIQLLWFKTVKRRRANASVVKSYLDLFQQRIPELLETIVNMTDDEGNTGLHYALTYKNFSVVSILLDSGECSVDMVNQAGYSPIMLAALAGFERKNDKYIMQRLLRMGDINKESADTGQTPLMLAVSRGNIGVVEMLLDAGCDINFLDDEGSTALMCACEHGNIHIVKALLANPECDATIEDNEGSTALSIAMDSRRKDLALLIYGSLNFDSRGKIKLSPSKQSLLGLGRRSPSPVIGRN